MKYFRKPTQKKPHFVPTKDRYSSVRCVILKGKHGVWKFFGKLHLNLFSLGKDGNIKRDYGIVLLQNITKLFSSFKTVYTAVKSVQEPSIMEKYPILQICRTSGFKIDWYIPKPENFCQLSGKMRLCIITTYFIWESSQFFTLSFHSNVWSWRMIFESGHRERAGFQGQAGPWLLCIWKR